MIIKASSDFLKCCVSEHGNAAALVIDCPSDIGLKELEYECNCDYKTCHRCWMQALKESSKNN